MHLFDGLPLLHGVVPWAVPALAAVGVLAGLLRRQRRWWTVMVPSLAAISTVLVAATAWYLRHSGTVRDHYPPTFGLWLGLIFLAAGVGMVGWGTAPWWRRIVSLLTVPVTCASAFVLVNAHYGYWPTVGDVLGRPLPHQITAAALAHPPSDLAPPAIALPAATFPAAGGHFHGEANRTTKLAASPSATGVHGALVTLDIPPGTSGFRSRPGTLYLPPAFFTSAPPPLPVLVLMAGTPGAPDAWPRSGALQTVDGYAARHHGVAPILAFVDPNGSFLGDTECVDGPAGKAETFMAVDVPSFLSGVLHVPLDPARWAIGGFSEGGTCGFELAVRHPETYGTFVDIAGDFAPNLGSPSTTLRKLYGGDQAARATHDPMELLRSDGLARLRGWFLVGTSDDAHVDVTQRLAAASRSASITVGTEILPGDHTWRFVVGAFKVAFPAIASDLLAPVTGTAAEGT